MEYKVCIKAAGKGTRLSYAKNTNKALLPVGGKAIISHLIEKFPIDVEIVIPVGHNASYVKDFLSIAYSNRKITFVDIDKYEGLGSGPGYSLLCCKNHLQCPFIFFACDTLVLENIPEPDCNWIGVSVVPDSKDYLVAEVDNALVKKLFDKKEMGALQKECLDYRKVLSNAFIGLAAVRDYDKFWRGLEDNSFLVRGELQVANGLTALIPRGLKTISFSWFDIGTDSGYERTSKYFKNNEILVKPGEFTYFENGKVIKFFAEPKRVLGRLKRAELLKSVIPEITDQRNNFYAYSYKNGKMLSEVLDSNIFKRFLEFCKKTIWVKQNLKAEQTIVFKEACRKFYYEKTHERIDLFYKNTGIKDKDEMINGVRVPKLKEIFQKLDWEDLYMGVPVLFHGDPQPENIIVSGEKFYLLDWREDFGGTQESGDIYYDLAKIYHALIISGEIIRNNQFKVLVEQDSVSIFFLVKSNLLQFKAIFEDFISKEGLDLKKVKLHSALIYLNICALHHNPYNLLLYYLGKLLLKEGIDADER